MIDKYAVLASYAQHMVDTGRDVAPFTSREIIELVAALEQAEQRITELEAKTLTVKLPDGYAVRSGHPINEGERGVMIPKEGGDWLHRFDVEHALLVAGFSRKIEGE